MSAVDIAAEVACLRQRLIGFRVANLYDLSPKTYVVKLARSSGVSESGESEKVLLLLESGMRFHTTNFARDKSVTPSGFTLKLRKHIRTRRLEDISQIGIDRVVDFKFGVGESAHHLLLELYAGGNVILTDCNYSVLTLLRSHRDDDKGIAIMPNHPYPLSSLRPLTLSSPSALTKALVGEASVGGAEGNGREAEGEGGKSSGDAVLKERLASVLGYGLPICEHIVRLGMEAAVPAAANTADADADAAADDGAGAGATPADGVAGGGSVGSLVPCAVISKGGLQGKEEVIVEKVVAAVSAFEEWLVNVTQMKVIPTGYILLRREQQQKQQQERQQQQPQQAQRRRQRGEKKQHFEAKRAGEGSGGESRAEGAEGEGQGEGAAKGEAGGDGAEEDDVVYEEFWPLALRQLQLMAGEAAAGGGAAGAAPGGESAGAAAARGGGGGGVRRSGGENGSLALREFETFDGAMDEFFARYEGQRATQQRAAAEKQAASKLEKIRADQQKRAQQLQQEVDVAEHKARLIEQNLADVDAAILAVREALAGGMDWQDLAAMVKEERRAGNPVAALIAALHLDRGRIAVLLTPPDLDSMDDEERTAPAALVEVDYSLSAYANARMWFQSRKKQQEKRNKTEAAHETALKAAHAKTTQQLAQAKLVASVQHMRKVHWFERFHWFISSENYVVISGRDAQQNEMLVKKYMRRGDLYVHADLHGAASTIIRNTDPHGFAPIPPLTLAQAGAATVCLSAAWDSKVVTSAWWVHPHQVSKTAPTGEYLTVGSFMIRGKKNFLPPVPLQMAFGFVFRVDESCLGAHLGERRKVEEEEEREEEEEEGGLEDMLDAVLSVGGTGGMGRAKREAGIGEDKPKQNQGEVVASAALAPSMRSSHGTSASKYGLQEVGAAGEGEEEEEGGDMKGGEEQEQGKGGKGFEPVKGARGKRGQSKKQQSKYADQDEEERQLRLALLGSAGNKAASAGKKGPGKGSKGAAATDAVGAGGAGGAGGGGGGGRGKGAGSASNELVCFKCKGKGHRAKECTAGADADGEASKGGEEVQILEARGSEDVRVVEGDKGGEEQLKRGIETGTPGGGTGGAMEDGSAQLEVTSLGDRDGRGGEEGEGEAEEADAAEEAGREEARGTNENTGSRGGGEKEAGKGGAGGEGEGGEKLSRRARARAEEAEVEAILAEEDVAEVGDEERERLTEIDSLTGVPLPSDVLLYAVPVCGPVNALSNFKYRVKITPGHLKKGKAVKQAVDLFLRSPDLSARERELIKAVPLPDLVSAMMSNAKITAPGLNKMVRDKKKGGK
ncbi:hypothetical protein CLOM_g5521 [Closterium sp. NIES-68]|nr:hypothetical protein CLOM_g5521 [Closterium sp. NIES-68]